MGIDQAFGDQFVGCQFAGAADGTMDKPGGRMEGQREPEQFGEQAEREVVARDVRHFVADRGEEHGFGTALHERCRDDDGFAPDARHHGAGNAVGDPEFDAVQSERGLSSFPDVAAQP